MRAAVGAVAAGAATSGEGLGREWREAGKVRESGRRGEVGVEGVDRVGGVEEAGKDAGGPRGWIGCWTVG